MTDEPLEPIDPGATDQDRVQPDDPDPDPAPTPSDPDDVPHR